MSLNRPFTLLATPLVALGLTAQTAAQETETPDEWNFSGFNRILLETGERAVNFGYSELILNAHRGSLKGNLGLNAIDRSPKSVGGEIDFIADSAYLRYEMDNVTVSGGLFPAYFRRMTGNEFDRGRMGAWLSDQLVIQGGVVGGQVNYTHSITDALSADWHVMGGTKIDGLSRFGNPQGPGFDAPVWGSGVELTLQTGESTSLQTGYNFTSFGEGPNGDSENAHYMFAQMNRTLGDITLQLFSEVSRDITQHSLTGSETSDTGYVVMAQARGPLSNNFGWRAAGGVANDVPAVEGFLTYSENQWDAQIGVAVVAEDSDVDPIANIVMRRSF